MTKLKFLNLVIFAIILCQILCTNASSVTWEEPQGLSERSSMKRSKFPSTRFKNRDFLDDEETTGLKDEDPVKDVVADDEDKKDDPLEKKADDEDEEKEGADDKKVLKSASKLKESGRRQYPPWYFPSDEPAVEPEKLGRRSSYYRTNWSQRKQTESQNEPCLNYPFCNKQRRSDTQNEPCLNWPHCYKGRSSF